MSDSSLTVVYDACVLYPSPLRNFLMHLALTGLFRARWSHDIHEEWMKHVEANYADVSRQQVEHIRDLMDAHVLDCLVNDYEPLIPTLSLPDPDDRHVLAAAIKSGADLIVTFNLDDFPADQLQPYGIEANHPDAFVRYQLDVSPDLVCLAAQRHRASLKKPAKSVAEYLESLERQGLVQTVAGLREYTERI